MTSINIKLMLWPITSVKSEEELEIPPQFSLGVAYLLYVLK
ncbi:unnamed protein product, partial [Rotaria socialis]